MKYKWYRRDGICNSDIVSARTKAMDIDNFVFSRIFWDPLLLVRQIPTISKFYSWCCDRRTLGRTTYFGCRRLDCLITPGQKSKKEQNCYIPQQSCYFEFKSEEQVHTHIKGNPILVLKCIEYKGTKRK